MRERHSQARYKEARIPVTHCQNITDTRCHSYSNSGDVNMASCIGTVMERNEKPGTHLVAVFLSTLDSEVNGLVQITSNVMVKEKKIIKTT